jgi:hypothetical protein
VTTAEEQLEAEARELREFIYGTATDSAWENMRQNWMNDIAWLRATVRKDKEHALQEKTKKQPANPLQRQ